MPEANGGRLPWTQRVVLFLLLLIRRLFLGELGQLFLVSDEPGLREVTGCDVPDELVLAVPDQRAAEAGPRLGRDSKTHENPSGIESAGTRSPSSSPRS